MSVSPLKGPLHQGHHDTVMNFTLVTLKGRVVVLAWWTEVTFQVTLTFGVVI